MAYTVTRAATPRLSNAIADGETARAPAQDAVFDALALKLDVGGDASAGDVTASGATVAIKLSEVPGWLKPGQLGTVDGTADNVQIALQLAATNTTTKRAAHFDAAEYSLAAGLTIANGSDSGYSTWNGSDLVGHGAVPFFRLDQPSSPLTGIGTRYKATAAMDAMLTYAGPTGGHRYRDIALNGNSLANTAMKIVSGIGMIVENLTFAAYLTVGLDLTTVRKSVISGSTGEQDQTAQNIFVNTTGHFAAGRTAVRLHGFKGSSVSGEENGGDPVRTLFLNPFFYGNRQGSTVWEFGFTDQFTMLNWHMGGGGTVDDTTTSIMLAGVLTEPGNYAYPQNAVGAGSGDIGQSMPIRVDETYGYPGPGNLLQHVTMLDQQVPLHGRARRYLTIENEVMPGRFPYGGYMHKVGPQTGRHYHNRNFNFRFGKNTRGLSNTIVNAAFGPDGYKMLFDGSVTGTISVVDLSTYLEDEDGYPVSVEGYPARYLKIAVTAASGNSFFYLSQPMQEPGVGCRLYENCYTTAWHFSKQLGKSKWIQKRWTLTNAAETNRDEACPYMDRNATVRLTASSTAATTALQDVVITGATSVKYTIYAKKGSGTTDANKFKLRNQTTTTDLLAGSINYDTGVWTYSTGSSGVTVTAISDRWGAATGWYKIEMTGTISSGNTVRCFACFDGSSETSGEYAHIAGGEVIDTAATFVSDVGIQATQNPGTGGSPGSTGTVDQDTPLSGDTALTQYLTEYAYVFRMPSMNGRALGTNGNDHVTIRRKLPLNTPFEIMILLPHWELGYGPSIVDMRPSDYDDERCESTLELTGTGFAGAFSTTTNARVGGQWSRKKRATPSLSVVGTGNVNTPSVANYTANAVLVSAASTRGATVNLTTTTSGVAKDPALLEADIILVSAEL